MSQDNDHFLWVSTSDSVNGEHPSGAEVCGVTSLCAIMIHLPVYHEGDDKSEKEHQKGVCCRMCAKTTKREDRTSR